DRSDGGRIFHPGEVDGQAVAAVGRAQPQIVGGDGTQLADLQDRSHPFPYAINRRERFDGTLARDEVLRLQLLAGARCELETEVRQSFVPRARLAELFSAILS